MSRIIRRLIWDAWNIEHVKKHGFSPLDVEWVLTNPDHRPLFQKSRAGTLAVWGKSRDERYLLVILAKRESGTYYPVTARPMSNREKHRFLRKIR